MSNSREEYASLPDLTRSGPGKQSCRRLTPFFYTKSDKCKQFAL